MSQSLRTLRSLLPGAGLLFVAVLHWMRLPTTQAQETQEQEALFRFGLLLPGGDLALQVRNNSARSFATDALLTGYNFLPVELPNGGSLSNRLNVGPPPEGVGGITYRSIAPRMSMEWTRPVSRILPRGNGRGSYRPPTGLYRVRWKWREPRQGNSPAAEPGARLQFESEPVSILIEPNAIPTPPPHPFESLYEKPIDDPSDPDAEPIATPTPKPAPARLNTGAPLEMAAVLGASQATIAFIFTNQGSASTSLAPLGSVGNGFTVVTPTNRVVRQTLKAARPTTVAANGQKVWKANITAFFKGRKLDAPGWYQLFWKLGERKAGPLWLYKAAPVTAPATAPTSR